MKKLQSYPELSVLLTIVLIGGLIVVATKSANTRTDILPTTSPMPTDNYNTSPDADLAIWTLTEKASEVHL